MEKNAIFVVVSLLQPEAGGLHSTAMRLRIYKTE